MFERILITPRQLYLFHTLPEDTESEVHLCTLNKVLSEISEISLEKYMCWTLFLRKLQAIMPANLLERDSNTGISSKIGKIFRITFFTVHLRRLVFKISNSNILFKYFSGIPITHNKSLITCNSHNDIKLKMHSLTKDLFRQSVSVTDLEQTLHFRTIQTFNEIQWK